MYSKNKIINSYMTAIVAKKKKPSANIKTAWLSGRNVTTKKGAVVNESVYVKPPSTGQLIEFGYNTISNLFNPFVGNKLHMGENLLTGSRESKLKDTLVISALPVQVKTVTTDSSGLTTEKIQSFSDKILETVNKQKQTPEGSNFWSEKVIGGTNIPVPKIDIPGIPDLLSPLKDAGKWLLFAGIGIIVLMLIMRKKT